MAATLQLKGILEAYSGALDPNVVTVDFLTGNLRLEDGGWTTRSAPAENQYRHTTFGAVHQLSFWDIVVENLKLTHASGVSAANIATAVRTISKRLREIPLYHNDPLWKRSYWLYAQTAAEAAGRRSLLLEGSLTEEKRTGVDPLLRTNATSLMLRLTRHPAWEAQTTQIYTAGNANWTAKGIFTTTSVTAGDLPSRIYQFNAYMNTVPSATQVRKIWVGLKPDYNLDTIIASGGIPGLTQTTGVNTIWEAESGTLGTDTTSVVDAAASNGNKARISFATATLVQRLSLRLGTFCSQPLTMIGRWLVLARMKADAGVTAGVQMRFGQSLSSGASDFQGEKILFSDTNWRLVELGEARFPAAVNRQGPALDAAGAGDTCIYIYAERLAGAANLEIDCICLVPAEHLLVATNVDIRNTAGPTVNYEFYFVCHPNDEIASINYRLQAGATFFEQNPGVSTREFYFPEHFAYGVAFSEGATAHVITDELQLKFTTVARYLHWSG